MARNPLPEAESDHLRKLRRLTELQSNYGLYFYDPYEKQRDFHALGRTKKERLLMAGNKLGKTYSGGFEVAFHTTGLYPDWWEGRRFPRSNRWWAGSVTGELTRDGQQRVLLGNVGKWGTGAIPKDCILDLKRARGIADAVESVIIRHVPTGDVSQLIFKSYADGREAWQAEDLEGVWFDEEPEMDIYIEGITRTNVTGGICFLTFTPLKGMSQVVMRFLGDNPEGREQRGVIHMTIDDADHFTPEERADIVAKYPAHEREARAKGIPLLGSGRIYPVAESLISEPPLPEIPRYWRQIIGMDFGWDHPTAAVRILYEPDNDCIHVVSAYRQSEAAPVVHAAAVRTWGDWIPVAWPKDALQHDKGSGEQLAHLYRKQGLHMLSDFAQFPDKRGVGVEAGIAELLERMQTGRFKVCETLSQWWEEFRIYHRKDGKITKEYDDLLDATRYAVMMLRCAIPLEYAPPPHDRYSRRRRSDDGETTWMGV